MLLLTRENKFWVGCIALFLIGLFLIGLRIEVVYGEKLRLEGWIKQVREQDIITKIRRNYGK